MRDLSGDAPVVETARLRLRARTLEDFAFFRRLWADPAVTRFIGGEPLTEEETWSKFLRMIGHWRALGFGYWVVVERENDAPIGDVGFGEFKRALRGVPRGAPEIGWVLAPGAQGKGYATEAAAAALEWAGAHLLAAVYTCLIEENNAASLRVAEKLGFAAVGQTDDKGEQLIILERAAHC